MQPGRVWRQLLVLYEKQRLEPDQVDSGAGFPVPAGWRGT